jgi:anti-sigma regulatory factor (Ser/Thr protein kinase)
VQEVQDRRIHSEERRFPPDGRSVRDARMFVQQVLGSATSSDMCDEELAGRAALIVSELAGNAVVHAGSPYTVRVEVQRAVVRGEVFDEDRHLPKPRSAMGARDSNGHDGHGGRGLVIVDAMADRWGAEADGRGGKVVWFELDVTDSGMRGLPDPGAG